MTVLIPDARRSLLGGLIDDAVLLRPSPPNVEHAVGAYQRLRATEHGWMVGRLVVPVSRLEELAGVLVRTLRPGSRSVPIVAAFDGDIASNASIAASVHTTLDPAARIEQVLLPHEDSDPVNSIDAAVAAGNGIHHSVLSMVALPIGVPNDKTVDAIAATGAKTLRAAGAWIDLRSAVVGPVTLSATIGAFVRSSLPFTVLADHLPAVTQANPPSGECRYGALSLLAATLHIPPSGPDAADVLADANPQTYSVDFGGLTRNGVGIRALGSVGADRSPLMSLTTLEAADTIAALSALTKAL